MIVLRHGLAVYRPSDLKAASTGSDDTLQGGDGFSRIRPHGVICVDGRITKLQ